MKIRSKNSFGWGDKSPAKTLTNQKVVICLSECNDWTDAKLVKPIAECKLRESKIQYLPSIKVFPMMSTNNQKLRVGVAVRSRWLTPNWERGDERYPTRLLDNLKKRIITRTVQPQGNWSQLLGRPADENCLENVGRKHSNWIEESGQWELTYANIWLISMWKKTVNRRYSFHHGRENMFNAARDVWFP